MASIRGTLQKAEATRKLAWPTVRYFFRLMKSPEYLQLELSNTCNANCVFCAYRYDKRPKTILDMGRVGVAIKQFRKLGGKNVNLTSHHGETFVDKEALGKIAAISEEGFDTLYTYTNASLLHKFGVENVLKSGLTTLRLSLPPLEAEIYRKIYQNNNYSKVLKNVHDLLVAFSTVTDKTVNDISIEFRADRSLQECLELEDYKKYVAPYVTNKVSVSSFTHYDNWSGAIKPEDLLPGMTLLTGENSDSKRVPCGRIFTLQVLADGSIRQCGCRVDHSTEKDEFVIGHIDDMSLGEAFRSPAARKNVASFITGNHLSACKNCAWYSPSI